VLKKREKRYLTQVPHPGFSQGLHILRDPPIKLYSLGFVPIYIPAKRYSRKKIPGYIPRYRTSYPQIPDYIPEY
jgi:hypothetical protein